jgi:hypothetical protein
VPCHHPPGGRWAAPFAARKVRSRAFAVLRVAAPVAQGPGYSRQGTEEHSLHQKRELGEVLDVGELPGEDCGPKEAGHALGVRLAVLSQTEEV